MLARAAFEALTVRSASVAISYFYVMCTSLFACLLAFPHLGFPNSAALIESQRQHRTNSVRYALAALLVLSYLYPSARYWDTSIGVGSTGDRPIEHAPYRIGSAHPLALVILAKLGNLFRSEACSPFMSILCVETFVRRFLFAFCFCSSCYFFCHRTRFFTSDSLVTLKRPWPSSALHSLWASLSCAHHMCASSIRLRCYDVLTDPSRQLI